MVYTTACTINININHTTTTNVNSLFWGPGYLRVHNFISIFQPQKNLINWSIFDGCFYQWNLVKQQKKLLLHRPPHLPAAVGFGAFFYNDQKIERVKR